MSFTARLVFHNALMGLGFGLFLAVQGVFFLENGAEPWQIGLILGVFAITVALAEVPLGALADSYGRLRLFRLSCLMPLAALPFLLVSGGLWGLFAGAVLLALGTAMESGTVNAWVAERITALGRTDDMQTLLGRFQAAMAAGITAGAVLGGYLPLWLPGVSWMPPTGWNLLGFAALSLLSAAISPLLFHEGEDAATRARDGAVGARMKDAIAFALKAADLRFVLLFGAVLGLTLAMIESYWQPRLSEISTDVVYDRLGWLTAGYFAMAIAGPILIGIVANALGLSPRAQLLALPLFIAAALWGLAGQLGFSGFAVLYLAGMLLTSASGPPAETLLNASVPDHFRSSVQSLASLAMRFGGAVSAFGLSLFVKGFGIAAGWQLTAVLAAGYGVLALAARFARRR